MTFGLLGRNTSTIHGDFYGEYSPANAPGKEPCHTDLNKIWDPLRDVVAQIHFGFRTVLWHVATRCFVRRLEQTLIDFSELGAPSNALRNTLKYEGREEHRELDFIKCSCVERYRFKQEHLSFLCILANVQQQPGWILPMATKTLVNITQTGDTDVWKGQVEGSEECGKFLLTAVERA